MGAKVHKGKAAKDYPEFGIKKGDVHFSWSLFRQKTRRSLTEPTRSQLEASEFKSSFYEMVDTTLPGCGSVGELEELASAVRELGEEQESKVDELPENFQQGEAGEKLRNRASELSEWADEIDAAIEELGEEKEWIEARLEEDPEAEDADADGYAEAVSEKVSELEGSAPDPE